MLFYPSVEEMDEVEEPRGAPALHLSSYILQDADEPDLPTAFDSTDKPNLQHSPLGAQLDFPFFSDTTLPTASRDPLGVPQPAATLDHLASRTPSENAPDSDKISAPYLSATALGKRPIQEHSTDTEARTGTQFSYTTQHPIFPDPPVESAARAPPPTDISPYSSATALGKRTVQEHSTESQARTGTQLSYGAQFPIFPSQVSTSSSVQFQPDEGGPHRYNSHTSYNPHVNSSMFNAAPVLDPTASVYQSRNVHPIGNDPALTFLPGYQATVSPTPVAPLQLKQCKMFLPQSQVKKQVLLLATHWTNDWNGCGVPRSQGCAERRLNIELDHTKKILVSLYHECYNAKQEPPFSF
ncbi:hypothetical protein DFH08DRAFT_1031248 [Mycena albidolilacea]|uniref:Uncharacterized protein n=1 Tax=Mycena albidolilacea TaxID=1033008 RepID=A0AAD7AKU0_9AGAR|nr:hypothetical protein DFH08DRAFT_1031248 [Mycena albidolilacea]